MIAVRYGAYSRGNYQLSVAETMEKIARLLFATAFLTIFSYLLFFSSMSHSGNGGEYWGYNGIVEPDKAARLSYENRDYRFLAVNLDVQFLPRLYRDQREYKICENHPFGATNSLRSSSAEGLHNRESYSLAMHFARQYNLAMERYLAKQMGFRCEELAEEQASPN